MPTHQTAGKSIPVSGVDHLLILVNELDVAALSMTRLGFTVTPRGYHSPHLGSANHTIMFQEDYLELWGVVTPTEFNAVHRANLARGEGVHTASLTALDINEVVHALTQAGIATETPVDFSRPVELPNGMGEARFTVVRPDKSKLPHGFMFYCKHRTPDVVWVPEWMEHANSARAIEGLVIQADDPGSAAQAYAPLLAAGGPSAIPGGMRLPSGKAKLDFLTPDALHERYRDTGLADVRSPDFKVTRVAVDDLDAARAALNAGGARFVERAESLLVNPLDAHGVLFEFVPQG